MKKYKIKFLAQGFTVVHGRVVNNFKKYDSLDELPVFDAEDNPVTEGLKLLEKNGRLEIVDVTPKSNRTKEEENDDKDGEPDPDIQDEPDEEVTDEETDEAVGEDTDEAVEETDETDEDVELNYTKDELEEKTVDELDDLAKENNLSGYSKLKKGEKIDFLLEELN